MSEKLETSKTSGPHHQLSRLVGAWQGMVRTWFEPDNVADESLISGTMKLILDDRFIMHEYQGSFGDKPLQGIAIYGYDLNQQKYQFAWMDSFHNGTAIMFSQGKKEDQQFNTLGSYAYITPEIEQHWGWRTEINFVSDDELLITAYNISPEGEETKATETAYKRVKE